MEISEGNSAGSAAVKIFGLSELKKPITVRSEKTFFSFYDDLENWEPANHIKQTWLLRSTKWKISMVDQHHSEGFHFHLGYQQATRISTSRVETGCRTWPQACSCTSTSPSTTQGIFKGFKSEYCHILCKTGYSITSSWEQSSGSHRVYSVCNQLIESIIYGRMYTDNILNILIHSFLWYHPKCKRKINYHFLYFLLCHFLHTSQKKLHFWECIKKRCNCLLLLLQLIQVCCGLE